MTEKKTIQLIQREEYQEIHIQLIPEQGESSQKFADRIIEILNNYNAKVIRATFFGKLSELDNILKDIDAKLSGIDFPFSCIEGDNCSDAFINGVYIFAVSGLEIKRLYENNNIVGSYFETNEANFCFLGGLYSDPDLSPKKQTENILQSADSLLNQVGLSYDNTIRTWFYLDDILEWYDDFNSARSSFFLQHDIFNKLVAASTGVGGRNPLESKVCLELMAIKPKSAGYSMGNVSSPLQCSAEDYGSAFSRAIMYSDSNYSSLTVSGTASINSDGKTMHEKDLEKQIELSFEVMKAIVESQNFSFKDIVRAYAYCSDKNFSKTFYKLLETNIYGNFAYICTENKICREDLMFELELDFAKKIQN